MEQSPAEPEPVVHDDLLVVSAGRRDSIMPRWNSQGSQAGSLSMQSLLRTDLQVPTYAVSECASRISPVT